VPTVEQYKLAILCQLVELGALGRDPVLPLRENPSDMAIRAVAELEAEGAVVFEDDSLSCRLTRLGSRIADRLIQKLKTKQKQE
jgi:hypothetical protein